MAMEFRYSTREFEIDANGNTHPTGLLFWRIMPSEDQMRIRLVSYQLRYPWLKMADLFDYQCRGEMARWARKRGDTIMLGYQIRECERYWNQRALVVSDLSPFK